MTRYKKTGYVMNRYNERVEYKVRDGIETGWEAGDMKWGEE